ncbi:MAG: protein translocase subunit SecF [Candidatus Edwardsbacteria bacterium]
MIQILKQMKVNFIGNRYKAYLLSGVIILIGLISIIIHGGFNYGVDFTGGTLVQIHFQKSVPTDEVRKALVEIGMGEAEIQKVKDTELLHNAFLIRSGKVELTTSASESGAKESSPSGETLGKKIVSAFLARYPDNPIFVDSEDIVGPKIGKELRGKAVWAVIIGWILILIYVAIRFDFRFGVASVLSLVHDVLATAGFVSLTNMEFNMQTIAVFLTIIGYSINDSIVVADRIRENRKLMRKESLAEIANTSVNQTLSRTVITSFTVVLVLIFLVIFGGRVLKDLAVPLLFGVIVGTYSSIFVVAAIVVDWEKFSPSRQEKRRR